MMKSSFNLVLGLALSGCTVNNYHDGSFAEHHRATTEISIVQRDSSKITFIVDQDESPVADNLGKAVDEQSLPMPEAAVSDIPIPPPIIGNMRLKPECTLYVPLAVPKPVQIDFKELEAATTSKEINAIALRNVRQLHLQIKEFSVRQQRHYADYVARCAVK
jgi:hypothetical protein